MPNVSQFVLDAASSANVEPEEAFYSMCAGLSVTLTLSLSDCLAAFDVDADQHLNHEFSVEVVAKDNTPTLDGVTVDLIACAIDGDEVERVEIADFSSILEAVQTSNCPQFPLAMLHAFVDVCSALIAQAE